MPDKQIAAVPFSRIWDSYPSDPPCIDKTGKPPLGWDNQCAVRLGVALARSGVSFASFPLGGRCPVGPSSGPMIGSAQRVADWLKTHPFPGCSRPQIIPSGGWESALNGRTGIVFFKDYWRRQGETNGAGTGDHIDLWNRSKRTPSIQTFLRFTLGISSFPNLNPFSRSEDNPNWFSDLGKSSQIWFWSVS